MPQFKSLNLASIKSYIKTKTDINFNCSRQSSQEFLSLIPLTTYKAGWFENWLLIQDHLVSIYGYEQP